MGGTSARICSILCINADNQTGIELARALAAASYG
jgi:hypothetical protein